MVIPSSAVRVAYQSAVLGYKPWHDHGAWNSSGKDSFWQLIDGGIRHGFFDSNQATQMFNSSSEEIVAWCRKADFPNRKKRIAVWKALRKHLENFPA